MQGNYANYPQNVANRNYNSSWSNGNSNRNWNQNGNGGAFYNQGQQQPQQQFQRQLPQQQHQVQGQFNPPPSMQQVQAIQLPYGRKITFPQAKTEVNSKGEVQVKWNHRYNLARYCSNLNAEADDQVKLMDKMAELHSYFYAKDIYDVAAYTEEVVEVSNKLLHLVCRLREDKDSISRLLDSQVHKANSLQKQVEKMQKERAQLDKERLTLTNKELFDLREENKHLKELVYKRAVPWIEQVKFHHAKVQELIKDCPVVTEQNPPEEKA